MDPFQVDTPLAAPSPVVLAPEAPVSAAVAPAVAPAVPTAVAPTVTPTVAPTVTPAAPAAQTPVASAPAAPSFTAPTPELVDNDGFEIERSPFGATVLPQGEAPDVAPLELESILPERQVDAEPPVERVVADPADRIYDLSEFGAVRIEAEEDDRIHDLAEFGAVRVA